MKPVAILVFVAAVAFAQGPGGPPPAPSLNDVKTYLGLSDTQIQNLQSIRTQERNAVQPLAQQIGQKQSSLDSLLQQGSTDAAALGKLLIDIQNLRKQITQAHSNFHDQAVNSLTADQKTKLKALEAAAQLRPAIDQAAFLDLLTLQNPAGPGFGMGRPGRGGMMGPGPMGPMGGGRRAPR